jgi:hypothetical protein
VRLAIAHLAFRRVDNGGRHRTSSETLNSVNAGGGAVSRPLPFLLSSFRSVVEIWSDDIVSESGQDREAGRICRPKGSAWRRPAVRLEIQPSWLAGAEVVKRLNSPYLNANYP